MFFSPSILSADFGNLERDISMLNESNADWIHVDVMDGVFVPNITFGFPVLNFLHKHAVKPLDVHLMIVDPDRYINRFAEYGVHILTVHYEACNHLHRTLQHIREKGMKAGVSINPHTPVASLESILEETDLILVMSVNPGFGAQKFISSTISKVASLHKIIESKNSQCILEVDGGITLENAPLLINAGANALVAGNSVFSTPNPSLTIDRFKSLG
jgi:ribulose-phosphate 3-epimerase